MFFKNNEKKKRILEVDNDFAYLEAITPDNADSNESDPKSQTVSGQLQFVFLYSISQLKAVEENAFSVKITIKSPSNISRHVIIKSKRAGVQDGNEIVDRILTHKSKLSLLDKSENIICEKYSDITSRINNQLPDALRTRQFDIDNIGLRKQKLNLRSVNEVIENDLKDKIVYPKLARRTLDFDKNITVTNTSELADERELYHKMMSYERSPSSLDMSNSRFFSTYETTQGLLQSSKKEDYYGDESIHLLNFLLFNNNRVVPPRDVSTRNPEENLTVLEKVIDDKITLKTKINLNAFILTSKSKMVVKFELLQTKKDESGRNIVTIIDEVEKPFDPNKHVSEYFYPIKPPSVRSTKNKEKIYFSITQKDKRANGIKIYKKTINNNVYSDYALVKEISIRSFHGPKNFSDNNSNKNEFVIYRFVPVTSVNRNLIPCEFTDVVIHEKKQYKHLVLVPELTEGGIRVHAYNKDPMVISAKLLVRNISLKQKSFIETGNVFYFSKNITKRAELLMGFQNGNFYEFTTKIQLKSGVEISSSHVALIEFVQQSGKPLSINFSNTTNSVLENDVKVNINAVLQTDQVGQISQLRNTVSKNYVEDSSKEARLDKYVFFNVIRYDVTTGEEADLGVILNGETFIDSVQSAKVNAPFLLPDRSYKYVITPLVREPDSFQEIVEKKDELSRRSYKFSPKKHKHPVALKKGTLLSEYFINNDSKHAALYGKLGTCYTFEIDNEANTPSIERLIADKKSNYVLLSWMVEGILSKIDHFMILKEVEGIRSVIGKSHCMSKYLNYKYELTHKDIGSTKYILIPVYSDYAMGNLAYSNSILIEESDIRK